MKSIPIIGGLFSLTPPAEVAPSLTSSNSLAQTEAYTRAKNSFDGANLRLKAISNNNIKREKASTLGNIINETTFNHTFNVETTTDFDIQKFEKQVANLVSSSMDKIASRQMNKFGKLRR